MGERQTSLAISIQILASVILVTVVSLPVSAQSHSGGTTAMHTSSQERAVNNPNGINGPPSIMRPSGPAILAGRVAIDDGTSLSDTALIQSVCKGQVRAEAYTDRKGEFTIDLGNSAGQAGISAEEDQSGMESGTRDQHAAGGARRDMSSCELRAVLPGFTSKTVDLARKAVNESVRVDVGTIALHRMKEVDGVSISVTTALAPRKAAEEYDKGRDAEKKAKWGEAQARFTKAAEIYPQYAIAWLELGRAQMQLKDVASAKASFEKSAAADPKLISPYEELAQLALQQRDWKALADRTADVLKLNAVSFPQYYYFNAVAHYYQGELDSAAKSASDGIAIDVQHRFPKLELLLGTILAEKQDYAQAAAHLRNYVQQAPNADDIATAKQQLEQMEKASGTAANRNK